MRVHNLLASVGFALTLAASSPVFAQAPSRLVIVNDAVMNDVQLLVLDALNCGVTVPDGNYWLNLDTGAWGFHGGPQEGIIGAACRQAKSATPAQPGNCAGRYWEDRMACMGVSTYQNPVYK
jgi:hypothetical protein